MLQPVPFETLAQALLDDSTPFPAKYLHRFSDISPEDLQIIKNIWPQVSTNRKHNLLTDLEDLSETDTLTCFDDLARYLLGDPDGDVRALAIRLQWESEDVHLVPVYIKMMKEDESTEARAAAANALGQFVYLGELEKIPAATQKLIEKNLLAAAKSAKQVLVRRRALESLGYSRREEVIPLIDAAYHAGKTDWLVSALFAMGRSCDERWNKQVLSQLRNPDDDVRSEAIHAAGELELKAARPALLDLLEDEEDPELRRELIWALSVIGGEGVRPRFQQLLDIEEDDEVVEFIEEAMDTLALNEDSGPFSLIDVDPDVDFIEEDPDQDPDKSPNESLDQEE